MKLLSRASINYFWLTSFILTLSGFLLFGFLYIEVSEEMKEQLQLQEKMVSAELEANKPVHFPLVEIKELRTKDLLLPPVFKDTLIYDRVQDKKEGYYLLRNSRLIGGKVYMIQVMTTYIGWGGYSSTILYVFIFIVVMIITIGLAINYFSNRKMLHPFLENLERLKHYSVSGTDELKLIDSNIDEFKEFTQVLNGLTFSARSEYRALREFTENASHEIQTPLSIARARLESLNQLEIGQSMASMVNDAKNALDRLSKVNKGLLLLAKLENQDFPDVEKIDLKQLILAQIDLLEDIISHKKIKIEINLSSFEVSASRSLVEVLISNLIANLLTYASSEGVSRIVLGDRFLIFSNPGLPVDFEEEKLFARFGKHKAGANGNGLGLAIASEICKRYNWSIKYSYEKQEHVFLIDFTRPGES